ncbi:2-hydroxyacid dehydrogenase [Glaciecola siphonariae]|uniref:2-hydroxyacid dehydrogenase n=1 Tax=Glaciecola siphonariae TaxID=521012 RepID=A0ABV9LZV9_9ALTE
MKVTMFSTQDYDKTFFTSHCPDGIALDFHDAKLNEHTAVLAKGAHAVCVFVNDTVDKAVIDLLIDMNIRHIALRCAGYNNVDIDYAKSQGMSLSRVPAYSPEAVAEHAVALMLSLNRKLHKAYNRVRDDNFDLNGLLGFNMYQRTVGVLGTGKIGRAVIDILLGFGCEVLCYDIFEASELKDKAVTYTDLPTLMAQSDIITLHCPLNESTEHMINEQSISSMKDGVMIINTSRGKLIDTKAVISGIKSKKIGYLGLDVYEMEEDLFFKNRSNEIIDDDVFQRLQSFPNVMITGHQGFFTEDALTQIARVTLSNIELAAKDEQDAETFL